ncbi:MAG: MoaD/ThiS family protein [Cyanobacteria bacterium J06638_7]
MNHQPSPLPPSPLQHPDPGAATAVTVLLFGSLRQAAGWQRRQLLHATGANPARLWRQLGLEPLGRLGAPAESGATVPPGPIRVAINHAFASPLTGLEPGDEVAFLPPISGG